MCTWREVAAFHVVCKQQITAGKELQLLTSVVTVSSVGEVLGLNDIIMAFWFK